MAKPFGSINSKIIKYRLILIMLLLSAALLGIVIPGSFSDHDSLLHFSAHFGISFLMAFLLFKMFTIRFQLQRSTSFVVVFLAILIFGAIYKVFEIIGNPLFHSFSSVEILRITGFYISMSQNIAGILFAFAFITYFENFLRILNKRSSKRSGR